MVTSSPVKRHGGKAYLAQRIRALFPPHTRYCEPYFGSGAVLFSGGGEGVAEFANDLDVELTNFWRVLSIPASYDLFARRVQAIPFSKVLFEVAKLAKKIKHVGDGTPAERSVDAAIGFFIRNRQSRQALGKDFATPTSRLRRGMNEQVSAWLSAVDGLPEFHARLRRVEIRCQEAVDFIRELDSPETLFYCDPPYVHETRSTTKEYGEHEMSDKDHRAIVELLGSIEGKFVLSGYRNELYDDFAAHFDWRRVDISIPNQASSAKTKERKVESLWMNYAEAAQ